ncbi:site-specific DNA-methyltransferase [Enterococcus faecalis]|uniref:DNA-methyltransferase n=1 Tax=Enterococcus faecalis TaxID=1351 RepID=UPI00129C6F24|nr:site-specific DNA-methyltransferase [Enterococcus faecalis]MRJ28916.1 site-specific DNA-methyltransferase [Enterococcus faecalis]
MQRETKIQLFNDHFQNYKRYGIPKAQLVIADIPYNLGKNAYASSSAWYEGGKIENGESNKANKSFFDTDENFRISEFMHFCSKMLKKEPKEVGKAPAMIVFCAFQQLQMVIDYGKRYGFNNHIPLVFIKKSSPQVLKANMKIVGATEYALVLYREKLPKFNNDGRMVLNWFEWEMDNSYPKIHPTQKPIPVIKRLIEIFTDYGDVVIDPCAGSGSTLRAAAELNRNAYGFEIKKEMYEASREKMLSNIPIGLFI